MKLQILSIAVAAMLSIPVFADQLAYIQKEHAEEAVELLKIAGSFVEHCEPCGENNQPRKVTVGSARAVFTQYKSYWEVEVNGKGVDLAYVFVAAGNLHVNLGILLGLGSSGTSRYLTAQKLAQLFPEKRKICGVIDDNIRPGQPQYGGDADLRIKFNGGEYILSFSKNPQLAAWLQARKPLRGCVTYDGRLHQGFEGTVIEVIEFTHR